MKPKTLAFRQTRETKPFVYIVWSKAEQSKKTLLFEHREEQNFNLISVYFKNFIHLNFSRIKFYNLKDMPILVMFYLCPLKNLPLLIFPVAPVRKFKV